MDQSVLIERSDGKYLNVSITYPEVRSIDKMPPLVILINSFPKYSSSKDHFFTHLAKDISTRGTPCVELTYSNTGNKTSETKNFNFQDAQYDLETLYAWAEKQGYTKIGVITEGMGAPILLPHLSIKPIFCVFLWPVLDMAYAYNNLFEANSADNIQHLKETGYIENNAISIGKKFLEDIKNLNMSEHLENIKAPTLIIHGEKDSISPLNHLDIARKYLRSSRLDITVFDDGEHGLPLPSQQQACLLSIVTFIQRYLDKAAAASS